jgi:hypothetical protein
VLALAVQARGGRLGFVNPALYAIGPSAPGSHAAIEDVLPPASPTAVLRNQEAYDAAGNPVLVTSLRTRFGQAPRRECLNGAFPRP